jgi:hypothetical protein
MLGTRLTRLEAVAARLETVAARLDRHDGLPVEQDTSPAVADGIIVAAEESLSLVFGPIEAALAAGERDRARLLAVARAPLVRALAAAPAGQQTSAARTALSALISLLVDRLAELHQGAARAEP